MKKIAALIFSTFVSGGAFASGYMTGNIGKTDIDVDGFDDATTFSFGGGYQFNENFALEGRYIDFGDAEDDVDPVWTLEADGFDFSAVALIPANEVFTLYGRIGVLSWDFSASEAGFGEFYSESGEDLSVGIGFAFSQGDQLSLTLEYQEFEIDDEDVSTYMLGGRFYF